MDNGVYLGRKATDKWIALCLCPLREQVILHGLSDCDLSPEKLLREYENFCHFFNKLHVEHLYHNNLNLNHSQIFCFIFEGRKPALTVSENFTSQLLRFVITNLKSYHRCSKGRFYSIQKCFITPSKMLDLLARKKYGSHSMPNCQRSPMQHPVHDRAPPSVHWKQIFNYSYFWIK